jgi:hypothetical protein
MKCYRLDKDNPRIRFSRQENNEKKTAADEPYEFCQDYQVVQNIYLKCYSQKKTYQFRLSTLSPKRIL